MQTEPPERGISFRVESGDRNGGARTGRLATAHGVVETPAFMPVATQGSVKGVDPTDLRAIGTKIILANAYHLHLRPGEETVRKLGGLQRFTGWHGPILTDSGGFQTLSLAGLRELDDDGVSFRSHIDGERVRLTPESVLKIQSALGSDIAMVLDDCPGPGVGEGRAREALERTLAWAARSERWRAELGGGGETNMAVFAISQGGPYPALRQECAERLRELPFDGFAVGGVSVGEDPAVLLESIAFSATGLPVERPRYLMGVGGIREFTEAIEHGFDLFDCVLPTRNARNGHLLTRRGGPVRIRNTRHAEASGPIEEDCDCSTCKRYSLAFLRHLFQRKELLAYTLLSIHNLRVFHRFLEEARDAIREGRWREFRAASLERC